MDPDPEFTKPDPDPEFTKPDPVENGLVVPHLTISILVVEPRYVFFTSSVPWVRVHLGTGVSIF